MKTICKHLKCKIGKNIVSLIIFTILTTQFSYVIAQENTDTEIKNILNRFAQDYRNDPMFKNDQTFGIEIDKVMWHGIAIVGDGKNDAKVTIKKGEPNEPTFYFITNLRTLKLMDEGKMNALTAGVKAFSTDYAPVDIEVMEGFTPPEDFVSIVLPFTFHFWTRGVPELIPFGQHYTRGTHGAQASIFYYDKGLRTGYGYLHPGQHANENPQSRSNPFSSMIILIKGKVIAKLDDTDYEIEAGNAFFIPPGMTHEVLNPYDEAAEFILLMFGDGA
jgi:mannose-6-phosphate isomerase-like protein (cupin superfamily)